MSVYGFIDYSNQGPKIVEFDEITFDKYRFQMRLHGDVVFSGYNEFTARIAFDPDFLSPEQEKLKDVVAAMESKVDRVVGRVDAGLRKQREQGAPKDGKVWTEEDERLLVQLYCNYESLPTISVALGRVPGAVISRLGRALDIAHHADAFDDDGWPRFSDLDVPMEYQRQE